MIVHEGQLWGYFLSPLGSRRTEVLPAAGAAAAVEADRVLVQAISSLAKSGSELVEATTSAPDSSPEQKSVVWRQDGYGKPERVWTFNFTDSFKDSAVGLLVVAITAVHGFGWALAAPAAGALVKGAWGKLSVLKEEEDGDAIILFEAISTLAVEHRLDGLEVAPSWGELLDRTGTDWGRALDALKKLRSRGIVSVAEWGDQAESLDHPMNRWRVAL